MKRVCKRCIPPRLIDASEFEAHRQEHKNEDALPAYQRGYGTEHRNLRAWWAPKVAMGTVRCWRCGELIDPRGEWDLGHRDGVHAGPEHRSECNRRTATHRAEGEAI